MRMCVGICVCVCVCVCVRESCDKLDLNCDLG